MSLSLFPCWQRHQEHPKLPVFHKRLLFASESGRNVEAVLSLVGDQGRITLTLTEKDQHPLVIVSKGSEGLSSLARAMNWAEWVISDFEATQEAPKRSKRGSRRVSVHQITGEAA